MYLRTFSERNATSFARLPKPSSHLRSYIKVAKSSH